MASGCRFDGSIIKTSVSREVWNRGRGEILPDFMLLITHDDRATYSVPSLPSGNLQTILSEEDVRIKYESHGKESPLLSIPFWNTVPSSGTGGVVCFKMTLIYPL